MHQSKSSNPLIIRRKWSKVVEPLLQYKRFKSDSKSDLNFPLDFFYEIEKMIQSGYRLKLNIPQTLTGTHDNFLQTIFQGDQDQIGEIKLTPSYSKLKFETQIERMNRQNIKKIRNTELIQDFLYQQQQTANNKLLLFPFVVMKQKVLQNDVYINNTLIWNSYEYKKINNIDVTQISQAYIFTKNLTASITRFFYFSNSTKSAAYKIDNEESYFGKNRSKILWKVKKDRQYSCNFIKIMHQNKSFKNQTLNLIQSIQKYLNKQVSKIVTDWIIDTNNRYYLIDVKEIQLAQPKPRYRISKSLTELLSTVTCNMCLQTCHHSQISKILTNKLINTFYDHLKKRGVTLSFRINVNKMNNLNKVCDLCYSLVVEETKLIEAEDKMSLACNFNPLFSQYCNTSSLPTGIQNRTMMPKLYQWRLFFYLENISDFFEIFSDLSHKYQDVTTIYLNLWIHDSVTSFEVRSPFSNHQQIKAIKIEHLFSQTYDISQFLQKAEIRVQILLKPGNCKPFAEGCIHGIQTQQTQKISQAYLQRKYKQMLIFNENSKYCVLGLYIGICNDGLVSTLGFDLKKSMDVYKIEKQNVNCLSLPTEWMEILDHNYCPNQQKTENFIQSGQNQKRNQIFLRQKIHNVGSSFTNGLGKTRQRAWSKKKLIPQMSQKKHSQYEKPKLIL